MTLSIEYQNIVDSIADYLGWDATTEVTRIDRLIKSGLQRFYGAYSWHFLTPQRTFTLKPAISYKMITDDATVNVICYRIGNITSIDDNVLTDTASDFTVDKYVGWYLSDSVSTYKWKIIANTATTITVETGDRILSDVFSVSDTFWISPEWTINELQGRTVTFDGGEKEWTISSNTVFSFTVSADAATVTGTDVEYLISAVDYDDLPDGLLEIIGEIVYTDSQYGKIDIIPIDQFNKLYDSNVTGIPRYAAIYPQESSGTSEQDYKIRFYPIPSTELTLTYKYRIQPHVLDSTNKYPYGSRDYGRCIELACLAEAEFRYNEEIGVNNKLYEAELSSSIARDKRKGADTILRRDSANYRQVVFSLNGTYQDTFSVRRL